MVLKVKDSFTGRKSGRNLDLQGGALLNQTDRPGDSWTKFWDVGSSYNLRTVLFSFAEKRKTRLTPAKPLQISSLTRVRLIKFPRLTSGAHGGFDAQLFCSLCFPMVFAVRLPSWNANLYACRKSNESTKRSEYVACPLIPLTPYLVCQRWKVASLTPRVWNTDRGFVTSQ